jgi:sirohydrochlorin cobaltochelatase
MRRGLILFAHGSRDPQWIHPFQRLAARVRARAHGVEVRLAFLESIAPDLAAATDELIGTGAKSIRIVPIFLGQGGHARSDLPALVDSLRQRHPSADIRSAAAVGEDDAVIEALVDYCLRQVPGSA